MQHIVIIPYFSQAEVDRYLLIAEHLQRFASPGGRFEHLLVSSYAMPPSELLFAAFEKIAPVRTYVCKNRVHGHPEGPSAMFWEAMDHIADLSQSDRGMPEDGGFSLWLESDMVPIKPDWLAQLEQQWIQGGSELLQMGRRVPPVYTKRWFRRKQVLIPDHINGGACYSKQFSRRLPNEVRRGGCFDRDAFQYVKLGGEYRYTAAFAFSTIETLSFDFSDKETLIVHGWQQNKDDFVNAATSFPAFPNQLVKRTPQSTQRGKQQCCLYPRPFWGRCPYHYRPRAKA